MDQDLAWWSEAVFSGWQQRPGPRYQRLAAALLDAVESRVLREGTRVPAERTLAAAVGGWAPSSPPVPPPGAGGAPSPAPAAASSPSAPTPQAPSPAASSAPARRRDHLAGLLAARLPVWRLQK